MIFDEVSRDDMVSVLREQGWRGDRAQMDRILKQACKATSIREFTRLVPQLSSTTGAMEALNTLFGQYEGALYSYERGGRFGPSLELWDTSGRFGYAACFVSHGVLTIKQRDDSQDEDFVQEFNLTGPDGGGKTSELAPFDPKVYMKDDAGNVVRFLAHPLDEKYITEPGEVCPDGMLPPQELEVRKALMEYKFSSDLLGTFDFLKVLFHRRAWERAKQSVAEKHAALRSIVNSSPEHKAAIRRIVHAMPYENGGREVLAEFLTESAVMRAMDGAN